MLADSDLRLESRGMSGRGPLLLFHPPIAHRNDLFAGLGVQCVMRFGCPHRMYSVIGVDNPPSPVIWVSVCVMGVQCAVSPVSLRRCAVRLTDSLPHHMRFLLLRIAPKIANSEYVSPMIGESERAKEKERATQLITRDAGRRTGPANTYNSR